MSDMLGGLIPGGGGNGPWSESIPGVGTGGGGGGNNWLAKFLPYFLAGGAGFGTIGNILANNKRNAVLDQQMKYTNFLQKMTPADIVKGISSLEQPLSSNLIKNVGNTVSGQLAERGLSQAPGIQAQAFAQGLAPYQLQEQQLAQNALFQKLGLPISSRPSPFGPFPQTTNTSQLWQALLSNFMRPGGGGGSNLPGDTSQLTLDNILFPSTGLTPDASTGGTNAPAPGGTQGGWG